MGYSSRNTAVCASPPHPPRSTPPIGFGRSKPTYFFFGAAFLVAFLVAFLTAFFAFGAAAFFGAAFLVAFFGAAFFGAAFFAAAADKNGNVSVLL